MTRKLQQNLTKPFSSSVFERGLSCYSEYADKCILDQTNRRLIEGEVMPAKDFYDMLCKDKVFLKDYLEHSNCFRYIEKVRTNQFVVFNNKFHGGSEMSPTLSWNRKTLLKSIQLFIGLWIHQKLSRNSWE